MSDISVIIPLYNKEHTIERALRSVLAQSLRDFTVVVVDDGSTDASVTRLARFDDPRVRIVQQANRGPGAARNRGAEELRSSFLAFLDSDDEWEPRYLETAMGALEREPDAAAHVAACFIGPDKKSTEVENVRHGIVRGRWRLDPNTQPRQTKRYVDFFHSSCVVVRREVFDRYGGFYEKDRCLFGEDSYLWLMLVMNHTAVLEPKPLVWFHTEDSSLGERQRKNHPRRPALVEPDVLRARCDPSHRKALEGLLAYYRLIETEALVRRGQTAEIGRLRRAFAWPRNPGFEILKRELRVDLRRWRRGFGSGFQRSRDLRSRS